MLSVMDHGKPPLQARQGAGHGMRVVCCTLMMACVGLGWQEAPHFWRCALRALILQWRAGA